MPRALLALLLAVIAAPAAAEPPRILVGGLAGVALQSDQYTGGGRVGLRGVGLCFLDTELTVLAGRGPDFWTGRFGLHLRSHLDRGGFHAQLIVGGSLYAYTPRGALETFCDRADLDCGGTAVGLDLGASLGYRWFGVEYLFGTGDLPLHTITTTVSFVL